MLRPMFKTSLGRGNIRIIRPAPQQHRAVVSRRSDINQGNQRRATVSTESQVLVALSVVQGN